MNIAIGAMARPSRPRSSSLPTIEPFNVQHPTHVHCVPSSRAVNVPAFPGCRAAVVCCPLELSATIVRHLIERNFRLMSTCSFVNQLTYTFISQRQVTDAEVEDLSRQLDILADANGCRIIYHFA